MKNYEIIFIDFSGNHRTKIMGAFTEREAIASIKAEYSVTEIVSAKISDWKPQSQVMTEMRLRED